MFKKFEIRPVDMCIYIDEHIYEPEHDSAKIFRYLQDLCYSLARKKKYFSLEKDYEDYSLYAATQIYLRLTNKKQFLEDSNPKKLPKIKSVLNYIKSTLFPLKMDYLETLLNCTDNPNKLDLSIAKEIFGDTLDSLYSDFRETDTEVYFKTIKRTIKNCVKDLPYSDPLIIKNLYLSCLISLLRSVTLSNENIHKLSTCGTETTRLNYEDTLEKAYCQEKENAPIVWHLPDSMTDLVSVTVNRIKSIICNDIHELTNYYVVPEDLVKDILVETDLDNIE